MNKTLALLALATAMGAGVLALSAGPASAYIVCNAHECWHSHARYHYREPGLVVHPDDWYFHNRWDEHGPYHWRGDFHRDRGFWRDGVWVPF